MRDRVRCQDESGSDVTLKGIQASLQQKASADGLPAAFYMDQVKYGGLIGGSASGCLVLHHPGHRDDYIRFAVQISRQGKNTRKKQEEQDWYSLVSELFDTVIS